MNYKKSLYNLLIPYTNNETIIFNSFTGAIGKLDKNTLKHYNENQFSETEIEILSKKGILIPVDLDEKSKINSERKKGIENNHAKLFRIWPTSGCNARCYYCFEKGIKITNMSKKTADDVVNFIDNTLNEEDVLRLEWFGGEPLLNVEIIDYIMDKLNIICANKRCEIQNSMISNGSLITEDLVLKMKNKWNIQSIQITLDGYDSTYNQIKNYYNPVTCNFKKVIEAIKLLSKSGIKTAIRMNYDTKNYQSLVELIEFLHIELSGYKKLIYYVFPVWSSTDEYAENSYSSTTIADMNLLSLFDLLVKYRMSTIKAIARLNYKAHACQAWNLHSYAILPNGDIAKCCESYNQVIGSVTQGITDVDTYNFWTTSILEEKCDSCIYLPLCQGGCKSSYFNRMPHCFAFKPIINEILKWYVSYLDNQCK